MYCNHDAEAIVWNRKYTIINKYKGRKRYSCIRYSFTYFSIYIFGFIKKVKYLIIKDYLTLQVNI